MSGQSCGPLMNSAATAFNILSTMSLSTEQEVRGQEVPSLCGCMRVTAQRTAGLEPLGFTTMRFPLCKTKPDYILLPSYIWLTSSLYGYLGVAQGDGI